MKRFLVVLCTAAFALSLAGPAMSEDAAPAAPAPAANGEAAANAPAQAAAVIDIAYLTIARDHAPPRNNTQPIPRDEGLMGAKLGIDDDNTTGKFTKQQFQLHDVTVPAKGDVAGEFKKLVAAGYHYVVLNVPAKDIVALADLPEAKDVVIFNAAMRVDRLRNADCRANVFHTIASRAMLTDALAQYLIKKKWNRWFLVTGQTGGDKLYADNVKRAAKKFGAKIIAEKAWSYTAESVRRSEQAEIPVFTQGPDYDVLIVADEGYAFGDDLMYRTWDPRPVAGTQGLVPADWHPAFDRWGATQLENRFEKLAGRFMTSKDFAAWVAVRSIGEAATHAQSVDFGKIRDYMLSADFTVGVFKGVGASYRPWDHQLRQPILLAAPYTVVSDSPQPEFIHPVSNLDTLGFDKPETSCKFK